MQQTWKIVVAIVIIAIFIGNGVYFGRQTKQKKGRSNVITIKPQNKKSLVILTKDYLVSSEWGQEGQFGMKIKFNANGTFDEHFAGETGDLPVSGSFEVQNNSVTLKTKKYDGVSFEEAQKIYQNSAVYIPDRTLALLESNTSLFFTHYLASNGTIKYWNRSSKVPDDEERQFESYILLTTQRDLKPKINATAKSRPFANSSIYSFAYCDPTCNSGPSITLAEVYGGILARTQFKETMNGVEDYWYLVNINMPWYSVVKLNGTIIGVSMIWMHGSELQ